MHGAERRRCTRCSCWDWVRTEQRTPSWPSPQCPHNARSSFAHVRDWQPYVNHGSVHVDYFCAALVIIVCSASGVRLWISISSPLMNMVGVPVTPFFSAAAAIEDTQPACALLVTHVVNVAEGDPPTLAARSMSCSSLHCSVWLANRPR